MKYILLTVAVMFAGTVLAYSSLEELLADMNKKEAEALRLYLTENPDAEDAAEAREHLIYNLINNEENEAALELLNERYENLPADKSQLDIGETFGEVVVPMIQIYRVEGRKEEALALIERARKDFAGHDMASIIEESLDEFVSMFDVPGIGDTMELAFTAIDGTEVNLASMTGRVVLVDFWATWCGPCLRAMPELKALYADFREKGFEIIGISLDEEREKLDDYLVEEKISWPQYFDGKGWENDLAAKFKVQSIPATFLIGPDGKIAAVDASGEELRALIAGMLDPAEHAGAASP